MCVRACVRVCVTVWVQKGLHSVRQAMPTYAHRITLSETHLILSFHEYTYYVHTYVHTYAPTVNKPT